MKSVKVSALCAFVLVLVLPATARPCTTFVLKDKAGRVFFGRNFDFPAGPGHIHVNLRGARKSSVATPGEKPLTWTARYGSISFNQNGREFPYGGINEAGLVVEQMWLTSGKARYPAKDGRYGLRELQWIQYQLDTAATVADVLASDRDVRISDNSVAPLHFLVADVAGGVAVVEYLAGTMVYRSGQALPLMACANGAYGDSLAYFTGLDRAAKDRISNRDGRISSDDRFSRAADMVQAHGDSAAEPVAYAFDILGNVASGGTRWSTVYDLKSRTIGFRTTVNPRIRTLAMADFNFACGGRWLLADIDRAAVPSDFQEYTAAANAAMIDSVWDNVEFLKALPGEARKLFAAYPQSVQCPGQK